MFVLEFHLSTVYVTQCYIYATFAIGDLQTYSRNLFMMLAWQYCVKIVCITWDSWLSLSILWSVRSSFSKALAVCITWDPWLSLMSILWSILCSFLNSSTVYVTQCYIYATFAIGDLQTYSRNLFMMLAWQYCVKIVKLCLKVCVV
jgi:hypothetical protein